MRRTIMYYPNIEIPDGKWLRQALLFWDEVSSIVPRSYENELYKSSRTIYQLREAGEFRAIFPDQLMNSEYYAEFEEEILNKTSAYFKVITSSNKKNMSRDQDERVRLHNEKFLNRYNIHQEKFSYRIVELLEKNRIKTNNQNWISVDNQLGDIYMASLAKYSALSDVNYTVIGTDQINTINKIYPIMYSREPSGYKTPFANVSLNILPTPHNDVPIETIIDFKKKYREELLSFRNQINKFEEEISNSQSDNELKEKTLKYKEIIEKEVRETIRMLRGSGINYFLSSVKSIINLKSPTLLSTYAAILGHELTSAHPAVTISGVGFAGTLDISMNYMSIKRATRDKLSDKGFLYLYYATRKGIVNDFT